jgi:hypothetical protein
MFRGRGAVRHDDRIDAMSQGVQWFIDALAQSAHKQQAFRKNEEWKAMMDALENHPQLATDLLATGGSFQNLKTSGSTKVWDWV